MRVPAFAPARNREVVREAREVYDLREANERRRVPCDVVAAVLVYARGVTSGSPRAGARGEHQTRDQQEDGPCAGILHGSPTGVIHAPRSATRSVAGRRSAMGKVDGMRSAHRALKYTRGAICHPALHRQPLLDFTPKCSDVLNTEPTQRYAQWSNHRSHMGSTLRATLASYDVSPLERQPSTFKSYAPREA